MVKKDLLEFIEKVENKAIRSVNERFDKEIKAKEEEVLDKYEGRINICQSTFDRFATNLNTLMADMKEDKEVAFHGSHYIRCGLSDLADIKKQITWNCDFMGEVQKIKNIRNKELDDVKGNYKKVYAVAKSMSSAKKIATYLKELGFDISNLEDEEVTSLVADIDKNKLFVCGENK